MRVTVETTRRLGLTDKRLHMDRYGDVSDVRFSTKWEDGFGGHDQASWEMTPHDFNITGIIVPGDRVDITDQGASCWSGQFVEASPLEDGKVSFHARGYGYQLGNHLALDDVGVLDYEPTSNPRVALGTAVDNFGMQLDQIVGPSGTPGWNAVPNTPVTETAETAGINYLSDLLTNALRLVSQRWAMWGKTLVIDEDPTTPLWRYRAGNRVLGASTIESASSVWVRYLNTNPPVDFTDYGLEHAGTYSSGQFGERQYGYDVTDQGAMLSADALAIASAMWEQVKRKAGITQSMEFTYGSGLEANVGGPAMLSQVRAGQMIRVTEVRNSLAQMLPDSSVDVVIGSTDYDGERLVVTPMGAAPRTLAQVLAKVAPRKIDPPEVVG